jgi:hypothetical protein
VFQYCGSLTSLLAYALEKLSSDTECIRFMKQNSNSQYEKMSFPCNLAEWQSLTRNSNKL